MAALSAQVIDGDGLVNPTYAAATATTGDTFPCDGRTVLHVKNGSGSSINVTLTSHFATKVGATAADQVTAVAAGGNAFFLLDPDVFADPTTGQATAVCSAVTTVTVAALRVP